MYNLAPSLTITRLFHQLESRPSTSKRERLEPPSPWGGRSETYLYSSHPARRRSNKLFVQNECPLARIPTRRAAPNALYKTHNRRQGKAYQSPCRPKTGTAISSAIPSTPATSEFLLPAALLLLGADDDAPGALAVAVAVVLSPAPVDDPSEAVVVVEASVVVVVDDDDVPAVVPVGRLNPPSLVLVLVEPLKMPVGVGVGVASAAVSAQ